MHSLALNMATVSPAWQTVIWVISALLLFGLFVWCLNVLVASYFVYTITLRRKKKDKWGREPKEIDERQVPMYEEGLRWHREHLEQKKDIHIVNKGLNLYGEYYDLGFDRAVMILSGRTESLTYGYYFAKPYAESGYNVIVFDPRAHGLSDGEFNTVGFEESGDDLAWAKYAHDELGMRSIVFHGICIGSAGGLLALTSEDCPDYIEGMVAEGMFANFGESVKNHLIERKQPIFMVYRMINNWMKHFTGYSMDVGPIDVIDKLDKPLLMLHSREDTYSKPDFAEKLYQKAGSKQKRIVWFPEGRHSMLRITDTEKYDGAIKSFLAECFEPSIK